MQKKISYIMALSFLPDFIIFHNLKAAKNARQSGESSGFSELIYFHSV